MESSKPQGDEESQPIQSYEEFRQVMEGKILKLEQTMVAKASLPDALLKIIEEKQEEPEGMDSSDLEKKVLQSMNGEKSLEQDIFSLMMLSDQVSTWLIGLVVFGLQFVLTLFLLLEKTITRELRSGPETRLQVPLRSTPKHAFAQALLILFAVLTYSDHITSIRNILSLPVGEERWKVIIGAKGRAINSDAWLWRIVFTNSLRFIQCSFTLIVMDIIVITSKETTGLLQDYAALFVISRASTLCFTAASRGYFGTETLKKTNDLKKSKIGEMDAKHARILKILSVISFLALITLFLAVVIKQETGGYIRQRYPECPLDSLSWDTIGDGVCTYGAFEGANIAECGWEGEDCGEANDDRYYNF